MYKKDRRNEEGHFLFGKNVLGTLLMSSHNRDTVIEVRGIRYQEKGRRLLEKFISERII